MRQNLRYAVRMMIKSPGFTGVAVLTLGLGIGANTAIFSVVNALVLRPLPLSDPERLMLISVSNPARGFRGSSFSLASFESLREKNRSFSGIAGFCFDALTLTGGAEPEQLAAARVSPNFFEVLGTPPLIGRGFRREEGEAGAAPIVLISSALWERRFAGDRAILGKTISLDQDVYTIIGVMPAEYAFPSPGQDVWVTRVMKYGRLQPEQIQTGAGFLNAMARLAPGANIPQADAEVAMITRQYREEHPRAPDADPNAHLDVAPLQDSLTLQIRPTLLILTGAVGFVLLIACANVAGLMMARATGRAKEIAVRAALGASRAQLVRQLLAESVVLSTAGAALGVLLAAWGVEWLVKADAGNNLPGFQPIRVDLAVLGFTVLVSMITGVAFGLVPALEASRPNLIGVLRDSGWGTTGGGRGRRLRNLLVGGQMGLSIVLLIGAGLLLESFRQVQNVKLGFDALHTLTARVAIPPSKYPDGPARARFVHEIEESLRSIPGVTAAAISQSVPLGPAVLSPILVEGQPVVPMGLRPLAQWGGATPDYFRTLSIPLLRGRYFTWADDEKAPRVLIVNEALARHFWPNQSALGKHITFTRFQAPFEIVGVVGDTKSRGLEVETPMAIFTAYPQWTWQSVSLTLRTDGDPRALTKALGTMVAAVDRDQPVTNIRTMDEVVKNALSQRRETMYLIAGFAAVALILAVIGLYGVMAYSVAQRTAEIGIRQAIGAQRGDIVRMVLAEGMRLSAMGIVIGVIAAIGLTRLLGGMLFHVSATDPGTFAAIAGVFLAVSLAACAIPARRATRIDPLEALRSR
jgi:putative ABC transport system permease protein